MKKTIAFLLILCAMCVSATAQIKIIKATRQKVYGGMGGVSMTYIIDFDSKNSATMEIDSIVCIADSAPIPFSFMHFDPCCKCQISFGYGLAASPRCETCPSATLKQYNTNKGVIIYYHRGQQRKFFKVKRFRQLKDLLLP